MWYRSLFVISVIGLFLFVVSGAGAQWKYVSPKNEFTDIRTPAAGTRGDNGTLSVICSGAQEDKRIANIISLVVEEDALSFHISRKADVKYRFDAAPAQKSTWNWDERTATLYGSAAVKFSEQLMKHGTVIIKIEDGVTMKFGLKGSRAAIEKVFAACQPINPRACLIGLC